jgi:hypothetical protein
MLSPALVAELKEIIRTEFDIELPDDIAREVALTLATSNQLLQELTQQEINKETYEDDDDEKTQDDHTIE